MFERLARTIDRADLIEDVRFITNEARVQNCETLNAILADYFASASLEENLAKMEAAGVTVAPVFTAGDLINHPYAVGPGLFDLVDDTDIENCPLPTAIPRLSETPGRLRRQAPTLGEHSEEILSEHQMGYPRSDSMEFETVCSTFSDRLLSVRVIWHKRREKHMAENSLSSVSKTNSLQEMGEFWDEHDFTEFDTDEPDIEFNISCTVSIEPDLLSALEKQARLRHIKVETLVNLWLHEKLAEQAQPIPA